MTTETLAARTDRAAAAPDGRRWLMLAVLLLGQLMGLLDVFIVNVAMPAIGTSLHASGASLQLIVGGYTIAYSMLLITGARLGDLYGRRRMYLVGAALFTVMSLACGLAPDAGALIAFRFAQGAGAAVMIPQIMSVIQTRFTGAARAKALSAYAVVLSAGAVAGLVVGGLLVNADLFGTEWRPVFLVNVPLGALVIALVPRLVPADAPAAGPRSAGRLDVGGLAIATSAVCLVVLPLVLGHEVGWPAWTFACIAVGLALAVFFVYVERRTAARGRAPLLDLAVLNAPGLGAGLATITCMAMAYGGFLFVYTLHLEAGLGDSALRAGLTYVPLTVAFGLVGLLWRRLPARLHHLLAPTGFVLCVPGYLAIAAAPNGGALMWTGLVLDGAGMGMSMSPVLAQALTRVPLTRAADASGVLTTAMQLTQVVGVATFGTLYLSLHASQLATTGRWLALLALVGLAPAVALARVGSRAARGAD